jgi:2-phosphoglycerate kinase
MAMRFTLGICPTGGGFTPTAFAVLIGGTSGSGKSSLAAELQKRLNGRARRWQIVSTDEIRQELRVSFPSSHLIWRSTYNITENVYDGTDKSKEKVIEGYLAQTSIVEKKLIDSFFPSPFSQLLLVEGVHITPRFAHDLGCKLPFQTFPVFLRVSDEQEHKHRFEVRGPKSTTPSMTDASIAKYFHYFKNIKCISDYITAEADQHQLLVVDNSVLEDSVCLLLKAILKMLGHQYVTPSSQL